MSEQTPGLGLARAQQDVPSIITLLALYGSPWGSADAQSGTRVLAERPVVKVPAMGALCELHVPTLRTRTLPVPMVAWHHLQQCVPGVVGPSWLFRTSKA